MIFVKDTVFFRYVLLIRQRLDNSKKMKEETAGIKDWLPIYKNLLLICSLVKYDVTGEITNHSVIFEVNMHEFSR